jgi:cysteate synthase
MELKETYCALCEHCKDSLLLTEYKEEQFKVNKNLEGIWKFNWLPTHHAPFHQRGPVIYKSQGLAETIGLENLYIAFNGYWPESGAEITTCTFKEFEAAVVLQNARR